MLLVVASRADERAARFVERAGGAATLLTCRDLSSRGWRLSSEPRTVPVISAGGRRVRVDQLRGVLTLLPGIFPQELVHIVPADRPYVAGEMTAFLLYWLSGVPCPVLNRPQPGCLSGPPWAPEQWLRTAADLGIPVVPLRRSTRSLGRSPVARPPAQRAPRAGRAGRALTVTVVGRRCLGAAMSPLAEWARALARAACTDLLSLTFWKNRSGTFLADAHAFPDISDRAVARAIAGHFGITSPERNESPGRPAAVGVR